MNFRPLESDERILILPSAQVLGDVHAGDDTSFWYNCVCRAERAPIVIGKRCNVQDNAVIHNRTVLGDDVSVGHGAIVHGATLGDRVLVGMGAVVFGGARIGSDCIIGAGAVVTGKMNAPDGSLLLGNPAKVVRPLTEEEKAYILSNGAEYLEKSAAYRAYLSEQAEEERK